MAEEKNKQEFFWVFVRNESMVDQVKDHGCCWKIFWESFTMSKISETAVHIFLSCAFFSFVLGCVNMLAMHTSGLDDPGVGMQGKVCSEATCTNLSSCKKVGTVTGGFYCGYNVTNQKCKVAGKSQCVDCVCRDLDQSAGFLCRCAIPVSP